MLQNECQGKRPQGCMEGQIARERGAVLRHDASFAVEHSCPD